MRILSSICGITLMLVLATGTGVAQEKNKNKLVNPNKQAKQAAKQGKETPAAQVERLLNMSPEERAKALSDLPPARRALIEKRLNNLESMPPEQREKQLNRAKRLENLPPGRQPVVRSEIQGLRDMPFRQRRLRLHSEDFSQNYSPEEQQLIREQFPAAAR